MSGTGTIRTVARARVRSRWRSLVVIGLVIGVIGGAVLGAVAGARRTSSAYDRLVERAEFPDAFVQLVEPRPGLVDDIAELPSVDRRVDATFAVGLRLDAATRVPIPVQTAAEPVARFPIIDGRRPDASSTHEVMVSPAFADALGVAVGDVLPYRAMTDEDFAGLLRRGEPVASGVEVDLRVVGTFRTPTDAALEEFPTLVGTPALHAVLRDQASSSGVWVHLAPGATADDLDAELASIVGTGGDDRLNAASVIDFTAERRAVEDGLAFVARGLFVAGVAVAVAGAVLLAQLALRVSEQERSTRCTLRQLGVSRRVLLAVDVAGAWPLVVVGALVAPLTAVACSGWMPLGVARVLEPDPGFAVDAWVLAPGTVVLAALVAAVWTAFVGRAPRPARRPARPVPSVGGGPASSLASWLALGGSGRRSSRLVAFTGAVVASAGAIGAAILGASLHHLVEHPDRWGWPADLSIEVTDDIRDDLFAALESAPEVAAHAEVRHAEILVAGRSVTAYSFHPRGGALEPLVLHGRAPASGEIALGPRTLDALGVAIGDVVPTSLGRLHVVGAAATFGLSDTADHASGALLGDPIDDPESVTAMVEVAEGIAPEAFPAAVFPDAEYGPPVVPAEIDNLAELRPVLPLATGALAAIAVAGVLHLGLAPATRGRRELAVLRSIGLPRSATRRVVAAAAMLTAVVAFALALPLGVAAGRRVWQLVAGGTDLPVDIAWSPFVTAGAPGVLAMAAVSGVVAGRRAVRRPPAGELAAG